MGRWIPWIIIGILSFLGFKGLYLKEIDPLELLPVFLVTPLLLYYFKTKLALWTSLLIAFLSVQLTGGVKSQLFFGYILLLALSGYLFPIRVYILSAIYVISLEIGSCLFNGLPLPLSIIFLSLLALIFGIITYPEQKEIKKFEESLLKEKAKQRMIDPLISEIREKVRGLKESVYSIDLERYSKIFLRLVWDSLPLYSICFFLADGRKYRLLSHISDSDAIKLNACLEEGEGIIGWVAKEAKEIFSNDYFRDSRLLGYYSKDTFVRSIGAVPIKRENKILGIITADSREKDTFDEPKRNLLRNLSTIFGEFINLVAAYEERHRDALKFSTLYEFTTVLFNELNKKEVFNKLAVLLQNVFQPDGIAVAQIKAKKGKIIFTRGDINLSEGCEFIPEEGLIGIVPRHQGWFLNPDIKRPGIQRLDSKAPPSPNRSLLAAPYSAEEEKGVVWIEKKEKNAFSQKDGMIFKFITAFLSASILRIKYYEKLEEMAKMDGLTQLINHRMFQEELKNVFKKHSVINLIILDIDHFKRINDQYGHPAGDKVLAEIGRILKEKEGIPARYGGEEFAIILPEISKSQAEILAQSILKKIRERDIRINGKVINITASIGIASYPEDAKNRAELIQKADNALYKAKESGRNSVAVA